MARILFCAFSNVWIENIWDSHTEGFIRALKRNGNQILCVRTNQFVERQLSSKLRGIIDVQKLSERIRAFDPELIITYNNSMPGADILKNSSCPVVVYPADVPAFWCDVDLIAANLDRYYFFETAAQIKTAIQRLFHAVRKDHFIPFGYVTDLQAIDITQDINLSFVGSIGNYSGHFVHYFQELDQKKISCEEKNRRKDSFYKAFNRFAGDTMQQLGNEFSADLQIMEGQAEPEGILCLTCRERMRVLSQLTDLDLKIYGWADSWARVLEYDHALFRCFDYCRSITIDENTKTFNRSKVSLNLPHANAVDGFSWRVCDILASNAVLLSVYKPDLERLMAPYFLNFPMFESPAEARELAKRLLADEEWRRDISAASQQMIAEQCRFEPRFSILEQYFGTLHFTGDSDGETEYLQYSQYLRTNSDAVLAKLKRFRFLKKIAKYIIPYELYMQLYERLK